MDNTTNPVDLEALGFIGGPVPFATPGINSTYPEQNPAPQIFNVSSQESPGFFGNLLESVQTYGNAALETIQEAPSHVVQDLTSAYDGTKSAVSTVGSDIGGGLDNLLGGLEKHVFLIFGVAVVGIGILLWAAGKSGAVKANVIL